MRYPDNFFNYEHDTMAMRGRWAAFAVGRAAANSRSQAAMQQQQNQANQAMQQQQQQADQAMQYQQQLAEQKAQAQQAEIDRLKAQQTQNVQSSSSQVDVTEKIQKLGDLHQKGLLTDEEFAKMKMQLLSQM
ncbi:MAG: SHOCT domain-containing protein [Candidatus Nitrosocosmicus sp.]|nr:SHOCT domain-containing protein [Candidatus Nitrosocosmicus sp.]